MHLRNSIAISLSAIIAGTTFASPMPASASVTHSSQLNQNFTHAALHHIEEKYDVTLGIFAQDSQSHNTVEHNADSRFAHASTLKAIAAAAVLQQVGIEGLQKKIEISQDDILPYSPILEQKVGEELTLAELSEAAVTHSDNAAANKIFEELGGPKGLQKVLTAIGDNTTNVSHGEPDLNLAIPGGAVDTTTARAMTTTLNSFLHEGILSPEESSLVHGWMESSTTGNSLIKAGLPSDWVVADKSGAGMKFGSRGDIAVVTAPGHAPVVVSIYAHANSAEGKTKDEAIAEAASVTAAALALKHN